MLIFRRSASDSQATEQSRKLVAQSRELLKQSRPDTFAGRKAEEPPPQAYGVIERWLNSPGLQPPK